ncbi:MAG: carboxypeptidase-like regulatory domain-containing protein, partial [Candidatus Hydrogenedentota bacterium]
STADQLNDVAGSDGANTFDITLGVSTNSPTPRVGWLTASPTVEALDTLISLSAIATTTGYDVDNYAWIEIKKPDYGGGAVTGESDLQQEIPLTKVLPDTQNPVGGIYSWSSLGAEINTSNPGTYKVFYYIKDDNTDDDSPVAPYLLSTVYRAPAMNNPPAPVPSLIAPAEGQVTSKTVFFAWGAAIDPDGDGLTYTLEMAEDDLFTIGVITKTGIPVPHITLSEIDGVQDLTTYHWRVIPKDEFGADAIGPHLTRSFYVNNGNPGDLVTLWGTITDISDPIAVISAGSVTITPTAPALAPTIQTGAYASTPFDPGAAQPKFTVTATVSGYQTTTITDYTIVQGGPGGDNQQQLDIVLIPDVDTTAPSQDARLNFGSYDTDNNGYLDSAEWAAAGLGIAFFDLLHGGDFEVTMLELLTGSQLTPNSLSPVYVDFGAGSAGDGTSGNPLRTFGEALGMVQLDGSGEITIAPGAKAETFTGTNLVDPGDQITVTRNSSGIVRIGTSTPADIQADKSSGTSGFTTRYKAGSAPE